MSDPIKELLAADALPIASFPPSSRYADIPVVSHQSEGPAAAVPHLGRRICPQVSRFHIQYEATIVESDRRDTLAATHIGDAELWWRLADANGIIDPRHLTDSPGKQIRVTLPADIEGAGDA